MMESQLLESLRTHVESHYPVIALVTYDEAEADKLVSTVSDGRKILEWNMARGAVNFETKQPLGQWCDLAATLENYIDQDLEHHFIVIRDAHLGLRDQPLAVARLKALIHKVMTDDDVCATIFLVSSQAYIPQEIDKFVTVFDIPLPDEAAIRHLIRAHAEMLGVALEEDVLATLAVAFQGLTRYEIGQLMNRGYQQDGTLGLEDVTLVHDEKRQILKKSGALEMLNVHERFDEIGGLEKLKHWLVRKEAVINNWTAARVFGVEAPKGVMIVGMPGCGKSLTAKATAALFNLPLLKLDMGSMMGKYVGQSEANMRRAIQVAEAVSPCVLWVDEVEKAFAGIGAGSAGSEVSTRLFGYFLSWMQEKTKQVFVIATANDIATLPPELLRKGRFDEIFYVDFPNQSERSEIFKVHLQKRKKLSKSIHLDRLAEATDGYSGADIESIVKEAIELAFVDKASGLDDERLLRVIKSTHPLREVMKKKIRDYEARFDEMKIKRAS